MGDLGVGLVDLGVWMADSGVWMADFSVWMADLGVWLAHLGVYLVDLRFWKAVSGIWLVDLGIWMGDLGVWNVDLGAWMTDLGVWSFDFVVCGSVCVFRRLLCFLDLGIWTPKRAFAAHCNNNRRSLCDSRSNSFRRSVSNPRAQHEARLPGKSCRKTGICGV